MPLRSLRPMREQNHSREKKSNRAGKVSTTFLWSPPAIKHLSCLQHVKERFALSGTHKGCRYMKQLHIADDRD